MNHNAGTSSLRRRRRARDPMTVYDRLPPLLRQWLSQAALPWSPTSAERIWLKARASGLSPEETLASLNRAEEQTLARDKQSAFFKFDT